VERARGNIEAWLRGMTGCTVIQGHARFEAKDRVRVDDEVLAAPKIFINVGGRAAIPDLPGLGQVTVLTTTTILTLDRGPEHLAIVGGSYVGLVFAQMYRRFGARVTVVERAPRLLPREDEDGAAAIGEILAREGITVRTGANCIRLAPHADGVAVGVDCQEGVPEVVATDVLLAVGRRPNTDDLGLDQAGVAVDARGYVVVDDELATNVEGIWALGDCNGRGAFTHTAYNDHEIVAANLLDGEQRRVSARVPGYALYIDPPLGRAGMTEAQARASGQPLLVGRRPMTRVGRAIERGETQGFMKLIVNADTQQILGATILGIAGDEAIHGILDLMSTGARASALRWSVPIHPTVSELLPTLVTELQPLAPAP
jgi:pyruvate/2-oxoglutarate dehydrogenase complex dihydrolipoamide dehydrogenase (E3) component